MNKSIQKYLSEIGTRGGLVKSEAKAAAVRANGKNGGRPRKPDSELSPSARSKRKKRAATS